jgi:hypothetical protein
MVQNNSMTSQLVVDLEGVTPEFRVKSNNSGLSPFEFQHPGKKQFIPNFGSQDLVRLAGYLANVDNYRIESFRIAYSNYHRLDSELEEEISLGLLKCFAQGGVHAVLELLDGNFENYVVLGVKLIAPNLSALLLQRHGILDAEKGIDVPAILSKAWMDLQLS